MIIGLLHQFPVIIIGLLYQFPVTIIGLIYQFPIILTFCHLQICSAILHGVSADYFVLIFIILLIVKALLNFIVISLYFIIAQSFMSLLFSLFSFSSELDQESLNIL
ncbi:hypothetical protein BY996DRAFT_7099310 [Phakopsora pachyrhizi]|nr:hypothetical protein BY996DRAFT_7099310 [Phakopsora pachyrhizi]